MSGTQGQPINRLTTEQLAIIVKALEERGAVLPCPRCGNNNFSVLPGYFNQAVQTQISGFFLGGPSFPSVGVVCTKCGFLSQHALAALGLMPPTAPPQASTGANK